MGMLARLGSSLRAAVGYSSAGWFGGASSFEGSQYQSRKGVYNRGLNTADNENEEARPGIVENVRDLGKNDNFIAGLMDRKIEAWLGTDVRFVSSPNWMALGRDAEWADDFAEKFENQVEIWGNDPSFCNDAHRMMSFGNQMNVAGRCWDNEGEAIAIIRMKSRGAKFQTCVELVDPERLENPNGIGLGQTWINGNRCIGGVEVLDDGEPVAYHFRVRHPSESGFFTNQFQWVRIERFGPTGRPQVIHAVDRTRAAQRRGLSKLAPSIVKTYDIDRYLQAELAAKRADAKIAVSIKSGYPPSDVQSAFAPSSAADEAAGEQAQAYSFQSAFAWRAANPVKHPDMHVLQTLPGEELTIQRQARSGGDGLDYVDDARRNISSNAGVPYFIASQRYDDMTYSSTQYAGGLADRTETQHANTFFSQFLTPILMAVQEEMFAVGALKPARRVLDYYANRAAYVAGEWFGPGRVTGDPVKEGLGNDYALNQGLVSPDMLIIKRGGDPRKVIARRASWNRKMEKAGLPEFVPFKMSGQNAQADSANTDNQQGPQQQPETVDEGQAS